MLAPLTRLIAAGGQLPPLFSLLAIMLVGVVLVSLLLIRLRQSLLVGYFICGIIIANSGVMDWLGGEEIHGAVVRMADFGIILLMFTLGLEFSLAELRFLRKLSFGGGGLQMALCGLMAGLAGLLVVGMGWQAAIVFAVALAMSSTAVSLKTFQDLGQSGTPGARFALAVAIFQDLFIIVFLLFLPVLLPGKGTTDPLMTRMGGLLWRGLLFGLLAALSARFVFPWLLGAVARTRNRELFTLTVIGSCVGLAFICGLLDLGLALGAFVAGLAVSESVYKHRILAEVMPMRDLFLTLFFVSVGLLVDLQVAASHWLAILLLTSLLMLAKSLIITLIARLMKLADRQALFAGLALSSAGEFSLLLLQSSAWANLWSSDLQQILLAAIALSMGLLPALMRAGQPISDALARFGWGKLRPELPNDCGVLARMESLHRHAIICGYGPVGQRVDEQLQQAGVPTLIMEMNAQTVQQLLHRGQPALFADASHEESWELAQLQDALLVAFTFPAAHISAEGLRIVRAHHPTIPILARARFAPDKEQLLSLGATDVIHDELEVAAAAVHAVLEWQKG